MERVENERRYVMKKWMMIGIAAALILGGCGKKEKIGDTDAASAVTETKAENGAESVQETEEMKEEASDFELHFHEVTIDGQKFSLPVSYKELETMGFHLESSQKDEVIEGTPVAGYSSWGDEKKGSFCMKYRFKGTGDHKPLTECDAVSFFWDVDSAEGVEVTFYGGIGKDSTREEVAAILDEVYADENGAQYRKALDEEGHASLSAIFDKEQLVLVELYNDADYIAE